MAKIPKFECERLPLDKGGYDRGGRYFGVGAPVYELESYYDSGDVEKYRLSHYRAYSKSEAREKHHKMYPNDRKEPA